MNRQIYRGNPGYGVLAPSGSGGAADGTKTVSAGKGILAKDKKMIRDLTKGYPGPFIIRTFKKQPNTFLPSPVSWFNF